MRDELTNQDYKNILNYYHISIPLSNSQLRIKAEKIMSNKLCKCIKKIDSINEATSIGICTKTIYNNKGYSRGKFNCKKGTRVKLYKRQSHITMKKR